MVGLLHRCSSKQMVHKNYDELGLNASDLGLAHSYIDLNTDDMQMLVLTLTIITYLVA